MKQCPVSFQPSDEDTVSLNVPMSNIMEEEQIIKEDSCHHLSPVKGLRMLVFVSNAMLYLHKYGSDNS